MKTIKIKDLDEKVSTFTSKSGLKVYIWPYDLSEEINMSLTVRYGSVDTDFKVGKKTYHLPNGIAHFLEHIKFNEKPNVTAHDFFYSIGSYTNAYTTYDHTSYEVTCSDNIDTNLTHLLYFVLNPYFTKELVQKEKGIIVEECKMSLDNPYNVGYQNLLQNLYKYNKKRNLVTGLEKDVKNITIDDVEAVFDNFYHPENMFLVVTGKINPFEIEKIVETFFADKEYSKYVKPKMITKKEPDDIVKESDSINTNITKEKLFLAYKVPKKNYKGWDTLNLRILHNIVLNINFGTTSEFHNYLLQNDLIDDFYYSLSIEKDHVVIIFEASTSYPQEVLKEVDKQMQHLNISEQEFMRKKRAIIATSILGYDDSYEVNSDIRMDLIRYNKIITDLKGVINSFTLEEAKEIVSKITNYKESYIILKPIENKSEEA